MPYHHPRSPYAAHAPDFRSLAVNDATLASYLNEHGSVDFSNALAVAAVTRALLVAHWGVADWSIPPSRLVPALPARLNYVLAIQDRLASRVSSSFFADDGGDESESIATHRTLLGLDVGTGASAILAILAASAMGASCVATDSDADAARAAQENVTAAGPAFTRAITVVCSSEADEQLSTHSTSLLGALDSESRPLAFARPAAPLALRRPPPLPKHAHLNSAQGHAGAVSAEQIWTRVVATCGRERGDFSFTMTNPPFFGSLAEARASMDGAPRSAHSGVDSEVACEGGERAFVAQMIAESAACTARGAHAETLFSAWLGFGASAAPLRAAARAAGAADARVVAHRAGMTTRWVLSWHFGSALAFAARGWRAQAAGADPAAPVAGLRKRRRGENDDAAASSGAAGALEDSDDDGSGGGSNVRVFSVALRSDAAAAAAAAGATAIDAASGSLELRAHATRVGKGYFTLVPSRRDAARLRASVEPTASAVAADTLRLDDVIARVEAGLAALQSPVHLLAWEVKRSTALNLSAALAPPEGARARAVAAWHAVLASPESPDAIALLEVVVLLPEAASAPTALIATCLVAEAEGSAARAAFDRVASGLENHVRKTGRRWRRQLVATVFSSGN
jgi:23S rRNA A1618 N6-methylase RlmF